MIKSIGYAAQSATTPLAPFQFERRDVHEHDIQLQILYCGICHTDIHFARNEWNNTNYPVVPGHEIVGKVTAVGNKTTKFKVNDIVAVGCMINSCGTCNSCARDNEQYCEKGFTGTYNSKDSVTGQINFGGYSNNIIVDEKFVLHVPSNLDYKYVGPLLCAGITTYSPLRHWGIGKQHKVAVVGLGGLGHMAVKFAHAFGAHVTMITTSPHKEQDAKQLGADAFLLSKDEQLMQQHANTFDFILNTIPRNHDINPYIKLLKSDGTIVSVGAVEVLEPGIDNRLLIFGRRNVAGSLIGGLKETQEMLDFCGQHNILPEVEMISMQQVNEAYERMLKSDVKYRFVIDMSSLQSN